MAKQYNVNIVGSLTNTDGVLSGFSASNYTTFSAFAPGATPYEIVIKFNCNDVEGDGALFFLGKDTQSKGRLSLEVAESKMYLFFAINGSGAFDIWTSTTLQNNTNYWVKIVYNGSNQYQIYLSTDGETYTLEGTASSNYYIANTNDGISYLGIYGSNTTYPFSGTIDLNESYIKVDGAIWWRGVDNITKIQLRRDTASNWTSVNPTLAEGEVGLELDTGKSKVGDGTTAWNSLAYSTDVFIAIYNTTTYQEVVNAINTGKTVLCKETVVYGVNDSTDYYYGLSIDGQNSSAPRVIFIGLISANSATSIDLKSDNTWTKTNKTFLTGITSTAVTNALGYTPVNKAGDTMTGALTIKSNAVQQKIQNNINYSTTASQGEIYSDLQFTNYADTRFNTIRSLIEYDNTGTPTSTTLILGTNKLNNSAPDGFRIMCNSSNVLSCTFPQTTCVDGQWVNSSTTLSTTTSVGTYNISLSSYLPNDSYNYEVLLFTRAYKNGDGNGDIYNDLVPNISSTSSYHSFYVTSNSRQFQNYFIFPVSTQRNITVQITTACAEFGLYALAYRRIGTNS